MSDETGEACRLARELFLRDDNRFGCAETVYLVLKKIHGLPNADRSGAAMALNGGFAHTGGVCGTILGAALALGEQQERENSDHRTAKSIARDQVKELITAFRDTHGTTHCRDLIGYDFSVPGEHDLFIRSELWKTKCMKLIEFTLQQVGAVGGQHREADTREATPDRQYPT